MRIFCVILIAIICYGCHNKEIRKEYYDNGQLKFEVEFRDGIMDGYHKEFYENGTLKTLSNVDNGIFRDTIIGYYDNGNLEFIQFKVDNVDSMHIFHKMNKHIISKVQVENKQVSGWGSHYNESGEEILKLELIDIGEEEPYINQEIHYNEGKIIDSLSSFYHIKVKDTIKVNEKATIEFTYKPVISNESIVYLVFGQSNNDKYSNFNNMELDTLLMQNFKLKYDFKYLSPGEKNIKGFFYEKRVNYNPIPNDTFVNIITSSKKMYFRIKNFVIDE